MYEYGTEEYDNAYETLLKERREKAPKPQVFLSPEWCAAWEELIQGDERYKQVAKNWEGSVVLVFLADGGAGIESDLYVFLDLWHGECRYVRLVPEAVGRAGEFVLQAEYRRWESIVRGELNVVKELATRHLKLTPFDLKKAVKLAAASQAAIRLVELAGAVGARFATELPENDFRSFKDLFGKLKNDFGI